MFPDVEGKIGKSAVFRRHRLTSTSVHVTTSRYLKLKLKLAGKHRLHIHRRTERIPHIHWVHHSENAIESGYTALLLSSLSHGL
jgi:hypothetical protein